MGARRCYIIGCYLAPDNTLMIESVVASLKDRPWGAALLVVGDLIMTLAETEDDQRGTYIAAALAVEGLEYMSAHFLPRRRKWGREMRTWSMVRERKVVRSRTDYILGTDSRLFWNVSVWEPRHNTDHYMVLGCLHSAPRGNTQSTARGTSDFPSNHRPDPRGRIGSSRPYGGLCQKRKHRR